MRDNSAFTLSARSVYGEPSVSVDGEVSLLVEQDERLLDDVAELAETLNPRGALAGDHHMGPAFA